MRKTLVKVNNMKIEDLEVPGYANIGGVLYATNIATGEESYKYYKVYPDNKWETLRRFIKEKCGISLKRRRKLFHRKRYITLCNKGEGYGDV